MILYRIGNWFYRNKVPMIPKLFNMVIRLVHNSAIFCESDIGRHTIFGYGGIGVVIHKRTVIGSNCVIGSNVTIGGRSKSHGVPILGSDCFVATGAKILGNISIGNNCVIGANAVVIQDVPDNCLVVGIPSKIIKTNINSKDFY